MIENSISIFLIFTINQTLAAIYRLDFCEIETEVSVPSCSLNDRFESIEFATLDDSECRDCGLIFARSNRILFTINLFVFFACAANCMGIF